ncbi:MAG: hypothetical protein IPM91_02185 [Bacteroidetes bacterium]|nr:hypothetical protein [Bacteroidota bacterium]
MSTSQASFRCSRVRCKQENFKKYLELCVTNKKKRQEITDIISKIGEKGFTNIGKTAISKLHPTKLAKIKDFLVRAFDANTIEDATKLCQEFDQLQISQVKQGIYSPWLFYINSELFPIVNNSHNDFKKWFRFPASYPECIKLYHQFNEAAGETDFAAIDFMAHIFTKEGKLNFRRYLYLNGKRIFKISHGAFAKGYSKSGFARNIRTKQMGVHAP